MANAGVIPLSTIDQTTVEDWNHVMAVDGRGMFLTCRAAIRVMAEQGSGSIVNLSSISGLAGQAGQAAYRRRSSSPSGLAEHLAVESAGRGIRVNAVAPGTIRTDAIDAILGGASGRRYVTQMEAQHPMGRLGDPREDGQAIAFLASDRASSSPVRCSPWTAATWLSESRPPAGLADFFVRITAGGGAGGPLTGMDLKRWWCTLTTHKWRRGPRGDRPAGVLRRCGYTTDVASEAEARRRDSATGV